MNLTPELKAFKFYRKNLDHYLEMLESFWGDDEKLLEMYNGIAEKFEADGKKLMEICYQSYLKSIERVLR